MIEALFLVTPECAPFFNMAADEWLFEQVSVKSLAPAILRLYSWAPSGITIGYNQSFSRAVDSSKIAAPITIIRRITGGRAIYHESSELTFSITASINLFPYGSDSISAVNTLISDALVKVFERLGLNTQWSRRASGSPITFNGEGSQACFQSLTKYELTAGGMKIAGGAQRKTGNFLIHQGSIKLNGMTAYPAISQPYMEKVPRLAGDANITLDNLAPHFLAVFASTLRTRFKKLELSPSFVAEIAQKSELLEKNSLGKR